MKYVCDKKYIGFDEIESEIELIDSLFTTMYQGYFGLSEEYVQNNALLLAIGYKQFSDLASIGIGLIEDMKETINIVRENAESREGGVTK